MEECIVCMNEKVANRPLFRCFHLYCGTCITTMRSRKMSTCPLCRSERRGVKVAIHLGSYAFEKYMSPF